MTITNTTNTSTAKALNSFDTLSESFEGGSFYGLEYILDDFFQEELHITVKGEPSEIDWFGLYQ